MAARKNHENGGAQEPSNEPVQITFSKEDFRLIGFVLTWYISQLPEHGDEMMREGPPLSQVHSTKEKIEAMLNAYG